MVVASPELAQSERRALRVLRMVHELHKRGFQGLRIMPGMSSSGMHWRCAVTHVGNILESHGAWAADETGDETARYTTGQEDAYFGWQDARGNTVTQLASKFLERFRAVCERGRLRDWEYAGWYVEMLGLAEQGHFPVAYDDWHGAEPNPRFLPTTAGLDQLILPMPPGGRAKRRVPSR